MQRAAWTDERLDDLARRMDAGFERVDREICELRGEMRAGFVELRTEIRSEVEQLRALMYRFGAALMGTLVASMVLDRVG